MNCKDEVVSDILEASSMLLESLSTRDSVFHRVIIRVHIETLLNNSRNGPGIDKSGLDWVNFDKPISLFSKIKVLDFFTYCCINCIHVLPQLKALERKFPVEEGQVVVIGVHSPKFSNEHATANVRAAISRYKISHPVVNDAGEHLWNAFGITCWPTLVVLGPDDELLLYLMGETHQDVLHLFVEEAVKVCEERHWIVKAQSCKVSQALPLLKVPDYRPLSFPGKVAVTETPAGLHIAVADTGHHRVVVMDGTGEIQHVVGCGESGLKDGSLVEAQFHSPQGLAFADPSVLYVADTENHAVRKVDLAAGKVETVVGDGSQGQDKVGGKMWVEQSISSPWDLAFLNTGVLLIAMAGSHQIWAYFIDDVTLWKKQYATGTCAAIAGSGLEENRNNSYPLKAGFAQPSGLTLATDRQTVYVADSESSTVRAVSMEDGRVSAVVGGLPDPLNLFAFGDVDGKGFEVKLQHPLGVAWSQHKQALYVCDSYNHKLKVIDATARVCSTVSDHVFNEPGGLCAAGNLLYVADTNNHCIKTVNLDDIIIQTMSITFKKSEVRNESVVSPEKEAQVTINTGGGLLELCVSVSVSDDIKPLPESPAEWTLALPEGWKETKAEDRGSLEKSWTLAVPPGESSRSCQLRPQCRLFYCHDNLCSRRALPFLVTVTYSDDAPTNVISSDKCQIAFLFSL